MERATIALLVLICRSLFLLGHDELRPVRGALCVRLGVGNRLWLPRHLHLARWHGLPHAADAEGGALGLVGPGGRLSKLSRLLEAIDRIRCHIVLPLGRRDLLLAPLRFV